MATNPSQGNSTIPRKDPFGRSEAQIIVELCFAVTICAVTIVSNSLIVLAIKRLRYLDTTTNSFIANLAYTDLGTAFVLMPLWFTALAYGDWILGKVACNFFGYAKFVIINVSLNILLLIALERYLKVVKTKLHRKLFRSRKNMIGLQVFSWLVPALSYSPPLLGWGSIIYYPKTALCSIEISAKNVPYLSFMVLSQPSPYIVCFCYYKIFRQVQHNRVQVCSRKNRAACLRAQEAESKILKTTFAVVCVFAICLTPTVISAVLYAADISAPRLVHAAFTFLLFSNSALNCLVYGYMNPQLKAAIKKTFKCCRASKDEEENPSANTEL